MYLPYVKQDIVGIRSRRELVAMNPDALRCRQLSKDLQNIVRQRKRKRKVKGHTPGSSKLTA